MNRRPNLRTLAVSIAALMLPLTILASTIMGAYLKSNNPDNVDVSQGLAYLQQTLLTGVLVFTVCIVVVVAIIIALYKQDRNFSNAKMPLALLVFIIVVAFGILLANSFTNQVTDNYLIENNRPTESRYFDALEKQKQTN